MSEQNIDLVRRVYDGFGRGDLTAALEPMADDIEWHEAGALWGGVYRGGEAIVQNVFGPALEAIPDLAITPEQFMTSGDTVVVLHRYTGTGKATGKKLNLLGAGVWELRAGKIQRYRQLANTAEIVEVARA